MAASDLGISILGYPLTTASNYAGRYLFSDYVCVIQGFWCFTFAQASLNTTIPISIYRYIAVCKPHLSYHLTKRATLFVILIVWIYTIAWTAPPLFGWSSYTYEPFGTSCSLDWGSPKPLDVAYIYILFFSCYLIHIVIISYCYYYVYKKSVNLKLHPVRAPISYEHAVEYKNYRAESKITTMCVVMVVVLIIVWAPYTFVCLALIYKPDIPIWWTTLPTMFAKLASMLNPFIYAATNAKFRATFTAVFKRSNVVQPKIVVNPTNDLTAEERRTNVSDIFMVDRTNDGVYIGLSAVNIGTGQSSSCSVSS
nr:Go-opsin 2/4/5 [Lottia peitaihoensis]